MGVKGARKRSLGLREDLGGLEIHANQATPHFAFSLSPLT